ncbi:MAG: MoxR family ATPase [Myxococcota bacterium]|jgi:MoxR-like ATPase|nr:MoxR family ATPase [Myxococcota bacterium]
MLEAAHLRSLPLEEQAEALPQLRKILKEIVRGQDEAIDLLLASLCAGGHILLEGVPGVGKTTLARCVAKVLGCSFHRIQFTADMLPSDVMGVQVLNPQSHDFEFKPGPIFAQVVLADEINRAPPKTQSALLEAMGEAKVSVEGITHDLPAPFSVIATQNPVEQHGAYPLPESQLDRFMVCLPLGYPSTREEYDLLFSQVSVEEEVASLEAMLDPQALLLLHARVNAVNMAEPVAQYLLTLVSATREHPQILLGASPRGAMALRQMCQARALLDGRDFVLPDDVKACAEPVLAHRLVLAGSAQGQRREARQVLTELLASVPAPR